jgi:hypothetical protein
MGNNVMLGAAPSWNGMQAAWPMRHVCHEYDASFVALLNLGSTWASEYVKICCDTTIVGMVPALRMCCLLPAVLAVHQLMQGLHFGRITDLFITAC